MTRPWPVALGLAALVLAAGFLAAPTVETHPRITTTLLWNRDIAPILQRRCYQCHSENNLAMSFATYKDGRPWAAAIREEVLTRSMPPWSAVAGYGHFSNDASLTQRELDLLVAWADGGSPSGQTLDEEATPAVFVASSATWEHGTPETVLRLPKPTSVPSAAPPSVTVIDVPTSFKSSQRIRGIAFKPGDRRVVRYAVVSEKGKGKDANRWLFTWTPWQTDMQLPAGAAYVVPAGATLAVEIAYRGTDQDVTDASEIGLYAAEASSAAATVQTLGLTASQAIAPGGAPARLRAESTLAEPASLFALWPEMGAEGRSFELTAIMPDGGVLPLLWLKDYRVDFRSPYVFVDPVRLPKGTRLVMTVYAANSGDEPVTLQPRLSILRVPSSSSTM